MITFATSYNMQHLAGEKVAAQIRPEIVCRERARADLVGKRPGWKNLRAVRKGRIHVVRDELLNTPAPILLDGLKALAAIIHPEIFKGICALAGKMEKS